MAVSRATAEDASNYYGLPLSKFQVVQSPIDAEKIERLAEEESPLKATDPHVFKIVMVGRLGKEKAHAVVIDALSEIFKEATSLLWELHIIGDGPLRSELEQSARKRKIQNRVVFHGHLNNPYSTIKYCDLLCLPSRYEGLPNALLEAMLLEVLCVASDGVGGVREASEDGSLCHLIPISTHVVEVEAWKEYLMKLISKQDSIDSSRLREIASHIRDKHSFTQWIDTMQSMIVDLARDREPIKLMR